MWGRHLRFGIVLLTGAIVAAACASWPRRLELAPDEAIAFIDINVVDGTGKGSLPHQDVVVAGDHILSIAPTGGLVNARQINGAGKTLLPGYIDAHVHLMQSGGVPGQRGLSVEDNLERYIEAGITTVMDLGGDAMELEGLGERTENRSLVGPRIFHTHHAITGRGSHPIPLADVFMPLGPLSSWVAGRALPQVEVESDVDTVLDSFDGYSIDYIKVVIDRLPAGTPITSRGALAAVIERSLTRGWQTIVHAGDADDAVFAAEAGAAVLAHLPWRGVLDDAKARRLHDSGVILIPTATVWENTAAVLGGHFHATDADRALQPGPLLDATERQVVDDPRLLSLEAELRQNADHRRDGLQAVLKAGVPLLIGTDSVLPGTLPGSSYQNEARALLNAGLPVGDLIVAMTSRPARIVAGVNAEFGVIAVGKLADLVVVEGDPFVDAAALWRISAVVASGRLVVPPTPSSAQKP